jgi:hypothetical protein
MARNSLSEEEALKRIRAQMSNADRIARAHVLLSNHKDLAATKLQAALAWKGVRVSVCVTVCVSVCLSVGGARARARSLSLALSLSRALALSLSLSLSRARSSLSLSLPPSLSLSLSLSPSLSHIGRCKSGGR